MLIDTRGRDGLRHDIKQAASNNVEVSILMLKNMLKKTICLLSGSDKVQQDRYVVGGGIFIYRKAIKKSGGRSTFFSELDPTALNRLLNFESQK